MPQVAQPALGLAIPKSRASDQTRCNAGELGGDLTSPTLSFIERDGLRGATATCGSQEQQEEDGHLRAQIKAPEERGFISFLSSLITALKNCWVPVKEQLGLCSWLPSSQISADSNPRSGTDAPRSASGAFSFDLACHAVCGHPSDLNPQGSGPATFPFDLGRELGQLRHRDT